MISAKMRMVGVDGPVAVMSWGPPMCREVDVRRLPPVVLDRIARPPNRRCVSTSDVIDAVVTLLRDNGALYVGQDCAVMSARAVRPLRQQLGTTMEAVEAAFAVMYFHPAPGPDAIHDIAAMVSARAITADAAARRLDEQAKLWEDVAETMGPEAVLSRLGDGTLGKRSKYMRVAIGPQIVCRMPAPRKPTDIGGSSTSYSAADWARVAVEEEMFCALDRLPSCLVADARQFWPMCLMPTTPASHKADPSLAAGIIDAISRDYVLVAIVPTGFTDLQSALRCIHTLGRSSDAIEYMRSQLAMWRNAARCVWGPESIAANAQERLIEQARAWVDACLMTREEIKSVVDEMIRAINEANDQRQHENGRS